MRGGSIDRQKGQGFVPAQLTPLQIAVPNGISKRQAITWLRGAGILEQRANGDYYVDERAFREKFETPYQRVVGYFMFGDAFS